MPDGATQERVFGITQNAAKRIAFLRTQEDDGDALKMRVSVLGGGCSGFQYVFDFDRTVNEDDHVFERDGVEVLVDDVSLDLLAGAQLDYKDELIGAYFAVENPNATASCGCGTSFSVG
ncbi:MAG: iron-sulfur cluster insertion protein ErpA [Alphaproteobacteria bacterium]|nr:iron-sulfur cluster insertion protein ErpA [Alphaproteobacteria bacterium]